MSRPPVGAGAECRRCGECCRWPGHVWLEERDLTPLAGELGRTVDELIAGFTVLTNNRAGLSLAEGPDGACVFLEGARCRVYGARPRQCRDFPGRWSVRGGCPGAGEDGI